MLEVLKEFQKLPKFPDGRINFSGSKRAPVINCFVRYQDRILILKRSDKVSAYKGKWNCIGGYIDEDKPVKEKVFDELREEIEIDGKMISEMKSAAPYELFDKEINHTWIVHPFLAELNSAPNIVLDFEHTDFKWIRPEDLDKQDIVFGLKDALTRLEKLN